MRRWIALATAASCVAWCSWELLRPVRHPYMDLSNGRWTDHFTHLNAARAFVKAGPAIWDVGVDKLLPRATFAERMRWREIGCHDCVFVVPGWEKPVVMTWEHLPRFYPPGDMAVVAPVAALYHFTGLSFTNANRLLMVLFLILAHGGIFLMLDGLARAPPGDRVWLAVPALIAISTSLHWALEGFYDVAMLVPLLLCWRFLGERRAVAAGLAFCVAAFVHFRSYYYAPWALAAGAMLLRDRKVERKDWIAIAAAALLGGASIYAYLRVLPALLSYPHYPSPLYIGANHFDGTAIAQGALIGLVAVAAFAAARSWLDVAMVAWLGVLLTRVHQTAPWYTVALMPWLCAPPRSRRTAVVVSARVMVFVFLVLKVHTEESLLPRWLLQAFG